MEKRKIIFDCDPGHDDIMAIMNALAHPEQLEILGYTTVCGNNYVDKITRNLCQVLTALGKDGKVAVGYDARSCSIRIRSRRLTVRAGWMARLTGVDSTADQSACSGVFA